jgi:hypothetical protein
MNPAAPKQKGRREYRKHGHYKRVQACSSGETARVQRNRRPDVWLEAKRWRDSAVQQKGGTSCPFHIKLEIDGDMLDVWLMLELAEVIAIDAKQRGTVLNRRSKSLSKLHEQYQTIAARFARRCESLQLDKGRLGLGTPAHAGERRTKCRALDHADGRISHSKIDAEQRWTRYRARGKRF